MGRSPFHDQVDSKSAALRSKETKHQVSATYCWEHQRSNSVKQHCGLCLFSLGDVRIKALCLQVMTKLFSAAS